jgi:hypothetical protein
MNTITTIAKAAAEVDEAKIEIKDFKLTKKGDKVNIKFGSTVIKIDIKKKSLKIK